MLGIRVVDCFFISTNLPAKAAPPGCEHCRGPQSLASSFQSVPNSKGHDSKADCGGRPVVAVFCPSYKYEYARPDQTSVSSNLSYSCFILDRGLFELYMVGGQSGADLLLIAHFFFVRPMFSRILLSALTVS